MGGARHAAGWVVTICAVLGFAAGSADAAVSARGYELVSPPDTSGVDVGPFQSTGVLFYPQQQPLFTGSVNGDRFLFDSDQSPVVGSPAPRGASTYVSERTATGWETLYVGPPGAADDVGNLPLSLTDSWATDLSHVTQETYQRLNSDDPGTQTRDLFGQDRARFGSTNFDWVSRLPQGGDVAPIGATPDDLTHLFLNNFTGELYLNRDPSQNSLLVSVYDDGTPIVGLRGNSRLSADGDAVLMFGNASSIDNATHAFLRQIDQGRTIDLGAVGDNQAFDTSQDATLSADGRFATVTTAAPLTADDLDTSNDVYRYDATSRAFTRLTRGAGAGDSDACSSAIPGANGSPPLAGCPAVDIVDSADGSTSFFSSPEILAGAGAAGAPQQDGRNLYVAHGGQVSFVAALSAKDVTPDTQAGGGPRGLAESRWGRPVRVSDDGSRLLFESDVPLAGADTGGQTQVFLYQRSDGSLRCVSCGSGGLRATRAASINNLTERTRSGTGAYSYLTGRNMTDDGRTVFFDSDSRLVSDDSNGRNDVYEYSVETGEVALVSSGTSIDGSFYLDNGADGRDAFFLTSDNLVPQDQNGPTSKIYDARRGGGFPAGGATGPPCGGESCRNPGLPSPAAPLSATAGLAANGNVGPTRRVSLALAAPSAAARRGAARTGRIAVRIRATRSGRVALTLRARIGGRTRTIATSTVAVRAGRRATVSLRLSRTARRELSKRRAVRAELRARTPGAPVRSVTFSITPKGQR